MTTSTSNGVNLGREFGEEMVEYFSSRSEIGYTIPRTLDDVTAEMEEYASDYGITSGDDDWNEAECMVMDWIREYHEAND